MILARGVCTVHIPVLDRWREQAPPFCGMLTVYYGTLLSLNVLNNFVSLSIHQVWVICVKLGSPQCFCKKFFLATCKTSKASSKASDSFIGSPKVMTYLHLK